MENAWLLFAILSAVTAALVAIFGKMGLEGVDATTATMIRAGIMFSFLIMVFLFTGEVKNVYAIFYNHTTIFYIFLSGIAGALSWIFYFLALKLGKATQVVPIDRLSLVFVVILAFLFLGEKITIKVAIGTALMVVGAILVALG